MVDCKNYKKGIRQLEWWVLSKSIFSLKYFDLNKFVSLFDREHRKMKMSIEDYIQKQRDITYLKLTREIQEVK